MANINKSVVENVPGEFFVDSTCIDCDTCRQLAPQVFGETGETAYVHRQPATIADERHALQALVSCPTGSIGRQESTGRKGAVSRQGSVGAKAAFGDFPLSIEGPVFYCGFNSPKSYGGNSYFIRRPAGNWLVDSPKFLPQLVRRFEELGGIANIFLTHRDDVADADRYARRFASRRFIHRAELSSQPTAEAVLDGDEPWELAPDLLAIPTPGHTAGHCALLFQSKFLFTGDHLAWDRGQARLTAFRDYCWDSWPKQTASMQRLLQYRFEWVLPGHGQRIQLPAEEMRRQLARLAETMQFG